MDLVVGELLLAAIGMDSVLSPERIKVTKEKRAKAAAVPARIARECRRYLAGDEFAKPTPPPEFDFAAAIDRITDGLTLEDTMANLSGLDDEDEKLAFDSAYRRAFGYLAQLAPVRMRQTTMGPRPLPPTDQERSQFRRAYAVANDPLSVLVSMEQGALSPAQPRVLQALYPAIYSEIVSQFQAAIIDLSAKRPKYNLPWGRDKVLQVFFQVGLKNKPLAREMQAAFAKDNAQQARKPTSSAPAVGSEPTPVDRLQGK